MLAARELARRYPALKRTWPAQRALAWREQRRHRRQPRRMASWFRDTPELRTRVFVSNLEIPEAAALCRPVWIHVSLLDEGGAPVADRRFRIQPNGSLVLELGSLLPRALRGRAQSGQVRLDFEGAQLGSSRAYLHWYNDHSLTSTHEKFGLAIPAVGGYWTVPSVIHTPAYRVHLAVINLDERPYESTVVLKDADGAAVQATVSLPPLGSRFLALDQMFADPAGFLGQRPGTLSFGNNRQPAMYYYFVRDDERGTWRAQHL